MEEVPYRVAADSEPFWAAVAEVAREHGVFRTVKVLILEHGKLKRLTTESHPRQRRTAWLSAPPGAFSSS